MQNKSSAFCLSTLTIIALALGSCLLALPSCILNPKVQGMGSKFLQGEWQQHDDAVNRKLQNYTLYQFKFTCDSFYVTMQSHSKDNYGADTCMKKGHWTEYAKGNYEQQSDTLHLTGFFCQPDFKLKQEGGCFRTGVYEDSFTVKPKADSVIEMMSTSDVLPLYLHLTKRTTCTPKPL
jgi:hypothetical protein